ncbi:MAG: hypothetical protein R3A47_07940 [Polyangiales bacterium]
MLGDTESDERYLYAIDATDGSVLVVDYTAESSTFGAVLGVRSGSDITDRLDIGVGAARALTVLTPEIRS